MSGEDLTDTADTEGVASSIPDPDDAAAYTIRPFERGDRQAYLTLHREAFDIESTVDWFVWKYEANPFVDHVPITVAELDGEVVGAVSAFPLRMDTGRRTVPVYISCEGFVHPDHRRRGVFTRLVSSAWERHADEMAFVTNVTANEKTVAAQSKYNDWRLVSTIPLYYRYQRPGDLLNATSDGQLRAVLGKLAGTAVRSHNGIRAKLGRTGTADGAVERHDDPPIDLLTSLYREHVPQRIHTVRDETLYGWRFENPNWEYTTYVAGDGAHAAATVVGTRTRDGVTTCRIVDVLPLAGPSNEALFESLLEVALDDHTHATFVSVLPGLIPDRVLSTFGFVGQDRFPLSWLTRPIHHGVRALDGPPDGTDLSLARLTDPSSWRLSYIEHDRC